MHRIDATHTTLLQDFVGWMVGERVHTNQDNTFYVTFLCDFVGKRVHRIDATHTTLLYNFVGWMVGERVHTNQDNTFCTTHVCD